MLAFFATLFTGIGGHYINRRWDRAVLFFCLFLLYLLGIFGLSGFLMSQIIPGDNVAQFIEKRLQLISVLFFSGILVLWIISMIITVVDRRSDQPPAIVSWTKSGVSAAVLTSILSFLVCAYGVFMGINFITGPQAFDTGFAESDDSDVATSMSFNDSDMFYEYLYLGGVPEFSRSLPEPPSGDGLLAGRFTYNTDPAAGVSFNLILNSTYRTDKITTDNDGRFSIPITQGTWFINAVETTSWQNKPSFKSVSLFYGGEPKLTEKPYYSGFGIDSKGYSVDITGQEPAQPHIDITITPDISFTWPESLSDQAVDATMGDTICWEAYPLADRYRVEIDRIERSGNTTTFYPIITKRIEGRTTLPLKNLKYVQTTNSVPKEYSVKIQAFSKDGTLLGENDGFSKNCFSLTGTLLIEDQYNAFVYPDSEQTQAALEAINHNEDIASAVKILIQNEMTDQATELLSRMDSDYSRGEKEALSGYIFSVKGLCKQGNEMFGKARDINPDICIPSKYHAQCNP